MNFKENLKKLIINNDLNNNQLAIKIGVSRSLITQYLNGSRVPSLETIEKLTETLNCSYDDLLK